MFVNLYREGAYARRAAFGWRAVLRPRRDKKVATKSVEAAANSIN